MTDAPRILATRGGVRSILPSSQVPDPKRAVVHNKILRFQCGDGEVREFRHFAWFTDDHLLVAGEDRLIEVFHVEQWTLADADAQRTFYAIMDEIQDKPTDPPEAA